MRSLLAIVILLCAVHASAQFKVPVAKGVPGSWELLSHVLDVEGKAVEKKTGAWRSTLRFEADGSYRGTLQFGDDPVVTAGSWKVNEDSSDVFLHGNRFLPPHDTDGTVADRPLGLVELEKDRMVIKEHLFSEDIPGTSTYRRR